MKASEFKLTSKEDLALNERYRKIVTEAKAKHLEYLKIDKKYRSKMTEEEIEKKRKTMKKNPMKKGDHPINRPLEPNPTPADVPFIYGIHRLNLIEGRELLEPIMTEDLEVNDYTQKSMFEFYGKRPNKLLKSVNFTNMAFTTGNDRKGLKIINLDDGKMEGESNQKSNICSFPARKSTR